MTRIVRQWSRPKDTPPTILPHPQYQEEALAGIMKGDTFYKKQIGLTETEEKAMLVKFDHHLDRISKFSGYSNWTLGLSIPVDRVLNEVRASVDYLEDVYQTTCVRPFQCKSLDKGIVVYWMSTKEAHDGVEEFNIWLKNLAVHYPIFKDEKLDHIVKTLYDVNLRFASQLKEHL